MNSLQPLFSDSYFSACWSAEFKEFCTTQDTDLRARLIRWAERGKATETQDELGLMNLFFRELWGYNGSGERDAEHGYTLIRQFPVPGAGEKGGVGKADLALGFFDSATAGMGIPQVLCEFKDIKSDLDSKQHRKGNDRSPVKQCFDYLSKADDQFFSTAPVRPTWGIVTNMNEFRLYHRTRGPGECQRFILKPSAIDPLVALTDDSDKGAFQRFLFNRIFSSNLLLTRSGRSALDRMLDDQGIREKELENSFYAEYRDYRRHLYETLRSANPEFPGSLGRLIRITQRLLDRFIFILFCEDMGAALGFPHDLLRNILIEYSSSSFYSADGNALWETVKDLFTAMNEGGKFADHPISRFNGGLFQTEPELESLRLPSHIFCARGQGVSAETLRAHPLTLLYFSAGYNFGVKETGRSAVIDLYALGRIFEQSITELEIMEAEAEGRESINKLSKRKTNGVYYTPEWVTDYIVRETIGPRLDELRQESQLSETPPSEKHIEEYRVYLSDRRRTARVAAEYLNALEAYKRRLDKITIVDPACGSGAFLVQALEFLLAERRWIAAQIDRITGKLELWDQDLVYKSILHNNIYGVDINPESVEITRLALWLHTALPGKALTALDHTIRCGNSLVDSEFIDWYTDTHTNLFEQVDERKQELINVFDWEQAFPEVFESGGFDCVIGNPPYVKLQNFKKVEPEVAQYLVDGKKQGSPRYASTQTGNFDLYLPFIERGIELLRPGGRMGYIAPNLWLLNEYGKGLRRLLHDGRSLERWIDFKSFQVFDEATTYTALQFFRAEPVDAVRYASAHDGEIGGVDWDESDRIPYEDLPDDDTWILLSTAERLLINRLRESCRSLQDWTGKGGIVVGIQTSADPIYHLERHSHGRYIQNPSRMMVEIEDELMRPLVSGTEAKRYMNPSINTYLLFPYDLSGPRPRLLTAAVLNKVYGKAWSYLLAHEEELRGRENGKMDDDEKWWGYVYPKNLDKQELPKLGVAQTVPSLRVFFDDKGAFYLNNVRVNGILPHSQDDGWYLLGILNASVADFVFRRIAKPKDGGWFEANKQFIAPLPIPDGTEEERKDVAQRARELQDLHTKRRDLMVDLDRRLGSNQTETDKRGYDWLWADVRANVASWKRDAPADLTSKEKTVWAREQYNTALLAHLEGIKLRLRKGSVLDATFKRGELRFLVDDVSAIDGIYLDKEEGAFITAQWRQIARNFTVSDVSSASSLVAKLLGLRRTGNEALVRQVVALDAEVCELEVRIRESEVGMNSLVGRLYGLTEEEIEVVRKM